jgi:hypothetical protein
MVMTKVTRPPGLKNPEKTPTQDLAAADRSSTTVLTRSKMNAGAQFVLALLASDK